MRKGKSKFSCDVWHRRQQLGISSQEVMAEYLKVSVQEYKLIETGHVPSTGIFLHICDRLNLAPMDYLSDVWREVDDHDSVSTLPTAGVTE